MLNLCLWIGNICTGLLLGNASIARGLTCCKKLARHVASRKSWSSVDMSDPCENLESTPGLKRMVWESRARMKLPNCYAYFLKVYLRNKNWLFQTCFIVFVSATIFNVQISPTVCEQYIINMKKDS